MKCQIPQISWHSRDPVLSIDFQPGNRNIKRLASGGTDSHVLIWYVTYQENKTIKIECASDLTRHSKSVNVVRFSPDGELLVSGDDEGAMFVWQLKEREATDAPKDDDNLNQEDWYPVKLLRGHLEDIYDVSWSKDGNFLVSASMDNSAIVWDMVKFQKVHIFSESKGYVQGVAWDPLNSFISTIGSDRTLRVYNINSKKRVCRVQWAPWSITTEKGSVKSRLFYDDTLQSYFRRLSFTPDGELLIVPSGIVERDEAKVQNTTYVFSRHSPGKPAIHLPSGDKYSVAARCNPLLYKLRSKRDDVEKENKPSKAMIDLPYRMIFAVAACDSVLLYDTEQLMPFASVSNIHYTHLTDLTWSPDGKLLMASSTDGYCSILVFSEEDLGEEYVPEPMAVKELELEVPKAEANMESPVSKSPEIVTTPKRSKAKTTPDSEKVKSPIVAIVPEPETTPDATKANKKPKMSIKNFFLSPKAASPKNPAASKSASPPVKEKIASRCSKFQTPPKSASKSTDIEPMEIDTLEASSEGIEVVFEQFKSPLPTSKDNLCKAVKSTSSEIVKQHLELEVSDCNAVLSPSDLKDKNTKKMEEEDNNDWKLELSQDSVPMDMDPISSTSAADVKIPNATPIASSVSDLKVTDAKPPVKEKRRIALVTLSNKPTMSSK